jgi:hypothetical protein
MLLHRIERHLRERRLTPSRFGREAVGDPHLVQDLRNGRELRPATLRRIIDFMEAAPELSRRGRAR